MDLLLEIPQDLQVNQINPSGTVKEEFSTVTILIRGRYLEILNISNRKALSATILGDVCQSSLRRIFFSEPGSARIDRLGGCKRLPFCSSPVSSDHQY